MFNGKTVFSQIMTFVPWRTFQKITDAYGGDLKVRTLKTHQFFRVMAFSQLTNRRSLRDTVVTLRAMKSRWFHMGITAVSLNNLSNAGQQRNWKIFADFAQVLMVEAKKLYADASRDDRLDAKVYALDSTTFDLCLSVFPWAEFRTTKAAVKVHTLLDVETAIPDFIRISTGRTHDVNFLDELTFTKNSIYVMDRAYLDFERLYAIHEAGAFFVTRVKKNTQLRRQYSREVDKTTGLRYDQTVVPSCFRTRKNYPKQLRRIKFYDAEKKRRLVFLTNNFELSAETITDLYRRRWSVEIFFKWIKQHLRLRPFFGQSENAVKCQIWIAISTYLLVAIFKKTCGIDRPMAEILQIFSVVPFENIPLNTLFGEKFTNPPPPASDKQLLLPGF